MSFFYNRLKRHLDSLDPKRSYHQLQFAAEIQSGVFSSWKKPKDEPRSRRPTDNDLLKLSEVEWLGLSLEMLKSWRAIDEYGSETIKRAFEQLDQLEDELGTEAVHSVLEEAKRRRVNRKNK